MFLDFCTPTCYTAIIRIMLGLPQGCSTRRAKTTDAPLHGNKTSRVCIRRWNICYLLFAICYSRKDRGQAGCSINPLSRCNSSNVCNVLRSLRCLLFIFFLHSHDSRAASCFPPPPNIIGWWPGDGSAADIVGTNNGILQGGATASAPGLVGSAFSFDGTNSFVAISNSAILRPTNFTIEAWVRFSGLDSQGSGGAPAGDQYIIFKQNTRSSDFEGIDLSKTRVAGTGDVFRFEVTSAAGVTAELHSSTIISTGVWYHVAVVRGTNFTQIYVNGALERQTNVAFAQDYGTLPLYLGTSGQSFWDHKFKGNLDEVSIYNRLLSSNEIASIFSAGAAGKCKTSINISSIPNQRTFPATPTRPIPFTIYNAQNPTVTASALDSSIVPSNNIVIGGGGTNRTITITPSTNLGVTTISVTASNQNGLTATTNFSFSVGMFSDVTSNLPSAYYGAVNWVDYDNDGFLDLFISGYDTNFLPHTWLFHNNHPGFTEVATPFPNWADTSADWADFDNDGFIDLVIKGSNDPFNGYSFAQVFRNLGGTNFVSVASLPAFYGGGSVTWADFDNDGKPDVLLSTSQFSFLMHNNGDGTFTNLYQLPGGKSSAADFNNDGWADILLSGSYPVGTKVYRNSGTNSFTDTGWTLPGYYNSFSAPGDYNNDGLPDLLLSGGSDTGSGTNLLFRNISGTLTYIPSAFAPLRDGAAVWGDFDNDGKLDFFSFGLIIGCCYQSKLYHNAGSNDVFTDFGANMPGCSIGAAAWGDFDNDGALDLVYSGQVGGNVPLTKLYHNDGAMPDSPPSAPAGLSTTLGPNSVLLTWNASSDAEQSGGLTYNVRMGTAPGAINMLSPMSDLLTGFHRVPKSGNAGYRLSLLLTNLPAGSYFWSVQAIDNAFKGSIFSTEQSFNLPAPVITNQPQSQTVLAGSLVHFQVGATGANPLSYQWSLNGTNISSATNSSLNLTNVQHNDSGIYAVLVSNPFGSVTSSNAVLLVNTPPRILAQPQSVTTVEGTPATFSVLADGDPPLVYQWFHGASLISGATNSSLHLDAVLPTDGGNYFVQITNASGSTNSAVVALNVPASAPVIVLQPQSQFIPPGLGVDATFFVTCVGTTPFSYQWKFNGSNIAGATGSAFTITNVQGADAGSWSVLITNPAGPTLSASAVLSIAPASGSTTNFIPVAGVDFVYDDLRDILYIITGDAGIQRYQVGSGTLLAPFSIGGGLVNLDLSPDGNLLGIVNNAAANTRIELVDLLSGTPRQAIITNFTGSVYSLAFGSDGAVVCAVGNLVLRYDPVTDTTTRRNSVDPGPGPMTASGDRSTIAIAGPGDSAGLVFTYNVTNQGIDGFIWSNDYISAPPEVNRDGSLLAEPTSYGLPIFTNLHTRDYSGNYIALVPSPSGVVFSPNQDLLFCGKGGTRELRAFDTATFAESFVLDFGAPITSSRMRMSRDGSKIFGSTSGGINWLSWTNIAPSFAIQPVTQSIPAGSNATFTTRVFGSPTMKYQWQRDGLSLPGATNSSLTVNLPFGTPAHAYTVVAYNPFGVVVSSNAYLTIISPPFVTAQPQDQTVGAGSNAAFSVTVDGSLPLYYQWRANGTNLSGATGTAVTITNAQAANAGPYTVVITNTYGRTTSSVANLSVLPNPPAIVLQPQAQSGYVGTNFSLSAIAIGSEPLSYLWYTNGVALTDGGRITGSSSTNLLISSAQITDSTGYYLIVTNLYGSATSSVAAVSIVGIPPSITLQPLDRASVLGLPTTFTSSASGTAPLSYQWQFNGSDIPGATNVSLTISNVASTNFGSYRMTVSSPYGATNTSSALLAQGNIAAWGNNAPLIPLAATNVCMISAGNNGPVSTAPVIALRCDGTVITLGPNPQAGIPPSATNIVSIAAGGTHSLALRADGTILAWGSNTSGQTNVPSTLSNVVAIAAGGSHSVALRSDGTVVTWGLNNVGQCLVPSNLVRVVAIAVGQSHTLALRSDGTLVGFGRPNDDRQASPGPAYIPPDLGAISAMSGGSFHNVALRTNGSVVAWGSVTPALTNLPPGLTNALSVAGGDGFSLALRSDGGVSSWGSAQTGTTNVPAAVSNAIAVAGGSFQALALISDGTPLITRQPVGGSSFVGRSFTFSATATGLYPLAYQWRSNGVDIAGATNSSLTLSNLTLAHSATYQLRVLTFPGVPFAAALSVPVPLTVIDNPTLSFWTVPGSNQTNYQASRAMLSASVLGNGPLAYQWDLNGTHIPGGTNADLIYDPILMTNAGSYDVRITNPSGSLARSIIESVPIVKTWGIGSNDAPANVTNVVATAVGYLAQGSIGGSHSLTLRSDGKIVGWGNNEFGQATVPASLSNSIVTAIAAGHEHSLALRSDGSVVAWGYSFNGVTNVPASASNVIAIACGDYHDLALRNDGTVVAWGLGTAGQTNVPASATNVVAIAGGDLHSIALRNDGTVIAWGYNGSGQTTIPANATNVIAIAAGYDFNVALRADGTLVQWGAPKLPQPTNLNNIVAISAGYSHATALRSDGTLVTWGNYYSGTATIPPDVRNIIQIAPTRGDNDLALFGTRAPGCTIQPYDRSLFRSSNTTFLAKFASPVPVTYQWQYNGTNIPGATNDTLTLTNLQPPQAGAYQLIASNSYGVALSRPAKLSVTLPLSEALDTTGFTWTSSGAALWFGQTNVSHDGIDAARSGSIGNNQDSVLQTTFAIAGGAAPPTVIIDFWWKVSSEAGFDFLEFKVDGVAQASISGEVDWQHRNFTFTNLNVGNHILQWRYYKDATGSAGQDAAWLDQVGIFAAPVISAQPQSVTTNLGSTVQFAVYTTTSSGLSYHWRFNGSNNIGPNSSVLTLNNVSRSNNGLYSVVVSNGPAFTISANATLKVLVPQKFTSSPLIANGSVIFFSSDSDGGLLTTNDLPAFTAQASSNLTDWVSLPGALSITNGLLMLRDTAQTNFPARFYRILENQ